MVCQLHSSLMNSSKGSTQVSREFIESYNINIEVQDVPEATKMSSIIDISKEHSAQYNTIASHSNMNEKEDEYFGNKLYKTSAWFNPSEYHKSKNTIKISEKNLNTRYQPFEVKMGSSLGSSSGKKSIKKKVSIQKSKF